MVPGYFDASMGTMSGDPLVPDDDPNTGNLNSLTYYCLDLAKTCSFVPNPGGQYPPASG